MVSSDSSFSNYLEFVSESNIPAPTELDVCPPRHPRYIIFSSLSLMPKMPTALHLLIAHIDDITRL